MVGESVRTVEDLRVDWSKIDEMARAIRDDNPVHRHPDAAQEQGHESIPAPLIYPMTALFERYQVNGGPLYAFDFGMDQRYKVLGEQAYEYERPMYEGDVLTGVTTLSDIYQRDGSRAGTMTFAVLETEYTDEDGDLVVTERRTIIETEDPAEGDDKRGDEA
jgi:acyl dehydratase